MFHNTVKVEKNMIFLKGAMTMSHYLLSFLKEVKCVFTSGFEFQNNGPDYKLLIHRNCFLISLAMDDNVMEQSAILFIKKDV